MKITDYFNDTKSTINKKVDEGKIRVNNLKSYIFKFRKDDVISLSDYSFMMKFIEKESSLTIIQRFNNINSNIKKNVKPDDYKIYIELYDKIYGKINNLTRCDDIIFDRISLCARYINFSDDQRKATKGIINFLYDSSSKTYGLYGYAGTGKTTLITSLINYLSKMRYIRKVVFTAPTNKAVNVMKAKYLLDSADKEKIYFTTIHKLLNYASDFTEKGEKIFVKSKKSDIWMFDIVIIDECSMISSSITNDIFEDIKDPQKLYSGRDFIRTPKILFIGDPAQLPPVNEISSAIFKKKIKSTTMTDILRNDSENVIGICNEVRRWVINKNPPKIGDYKGGKVKIYKCKDNKKLNTRWFKECIKHFKDNDKYSNVVLTWTNKQSNIYNTEIRRHMLNKKRLNRFEIGDILILTNYYNLKEGDDKNGKKFYTSEQIKIVDIEHVLRGSERFTEDMKIGRCKNMAYVKDKLKKCITSINKSTKNQYNVWKLAVVQLINSRDISYINENNTYTIYVIKKSSEHVLQVDKQIATEKINYLKYDYQAILKDQFNSLEKKIIKPLWRQLNERYVDPFAKVSISTSITVHRSQGSTYHNVFVDASDIFLNKNENEARRCIYTALTRTSNEVHILI